MRPNFYLISGLLTCFFLTEAPARAAQEQSLSFTELATQEGLTTRECVRRLAALVAHDFNGHGGIAVGYGFSDLDSMFTLLRTPLALTGEIKQAFRTLDKNAPDSFTLSRTVGFIERKDNIILCMGDRDCILRHPSPRSDNFTSSFAPQNWQVGSLDANLAQPNVSDKVGLIQLEFLTMRTPQAGVEWAERWVAEFVSEASIAATHDFLSIWILRNRRLRSLGAKTDSLFDRYIKEKDGVTYVDPILYFTLTVGRKYDALCDALKIFNPEFSPTRELELRNQAIREITAHAGVQAIEIFKLYPDLVFDRVRAWSEKMELAVAIVKSAAVLKVPQFAEPKTPEVAALNDNITYGLLANIVGNYLRYDGEGNRPLQYNIVSLLKNMDRATSHEPAAEPLVASMAQNINLPYHIRVLALQLKLKWEGKDPRAEIAELNTHLQEAGQLEHDILIERLVDALFQAVRGAPVRDQVLAALEEVSKFSSPDNYPMVSVYLEMVRAAPGVELDVQKAIDEALTKYTENMKRLYLRDARFEFSAATQRRIEAREWTNEKLQNAKRKMITSLEGGQIAQAVNRLEDLAINAPFPLILTQMSLVDDAFKYYLTMRDQLTVSDREILDQEFMRTFKNQADADAIPQCTQIFVLCTSNLQTPILGLIKYKNDLIKRVESELDKVQKNLRKLRTIRK